MLHLCAKELLVRSRNLADLQKLRVCSTQSSGFMRVMLDGLITREQGAPAAFTQAEDAYTAASAAAVQANLALFAINPVASSAAAALIAGYATITSGVSHLAALSFGGGLSLYGLDAIINTCTSQLSIIDGCSSIVDNVSAASAVAVATAASIPVQELHAGESNLGWPG